MEADGRGTPVPCGGSFPRGIGQWVARRAGHYLCEARKIDFVSFWLMHGSPPKVRTESGKPELSRRSARFSAEKKAWPDSETTRDVSKQPILWKPPEDCPAATRLGSN